MVGAVGRGENLPADPLIRIQVAHGDLAIHAVRTTPDAPTETPIVADIQPAIHLSAVVARACSLRAGRASIQLDNDDGAFAPNGPLFVRSDDDRQEVAISDPQDAPRRGAHIRREVAGVGSIRMSARANTRILMNGPPVTLLRLPTGAARVDPRSRLPARGEIQRLR